MDVSNEQKGSNKPPLLPKPCLSSTSSGPTEHVIPQMVITSPEDDEGTVCAAEILQVPDISLPETSSSEKLVESKNTILQSEITQKDLVENGNQPEIQKVDVPQSEKKTKVEDSVSHSAIQRPLIFESDKCVSESHIEEPNIPGSSESPSPPPSLPATTSQRPLVFGGSSQQIETFVLAREENFEECNLDFYSTENGMEDRDGIVLDELNLNEECKTPVPDSKPKSSSFSWMPTFPKLHASGKENKTSDVSVVKKDQELADSQRLQSTESSPTIKDGLQNVKKFFDNLLHDTASESKNISDLPNEIIETSGDDTKKVHKDGKHGMKKLFSSHKQEQQTAEKGILAQFEPKTDVEGVVKEHPKDSKSNIKKMFDSFKPVDKKDSSIKKETDVPQIGATDVQVESKSEVDGVAKEHPKESKSNIKKMFDSFKPGDKKDTPIKKATDVPQIGATDVQVEPKSEVDGVAKEHTKESKSNIKKMFDSFKSGDKKDTPIKKETDLPQIAAASVQVLPKSEVEGATKEHPKDSKSNMKKMFDSFKPVDKKDSPIKKETDVPQIGATDVPLEPKPEVDGVAKEHPKESKSNIKKMFDSFKPGDKKDSPIKKEIDIPQIGSTASVLTEPKSEVEGATKEHPKDSKSNIKKMFDSFKSVDKKDSPIKKETDLTPIGTASVETEPNFEVDGVSKEHPKDSKSNIKKMFDSFKPVDKKDTPIKKDTDIPQIEISSDVLETQKESKSGFKKFFESFKHEDVPIDTNASDKSTRTEFTPYENEAQITSQKTKTSLKHSDIKQPDNKESCTHDSVKKVDPQDSSIASNKNNTDQTKFNEETVAKQKDSEHGVKKFFHPFRHEAPGSKEQTGKFHVKFLDRETSLKRSHSFKESILLKDPKSPDDYERPRKESFHSVKKYFSTTKTTELDSVKDIEKSKSKEIKRSQSCKETLAEKESFHGIRGFFDSFTHKISPKVSSQTALSPINKQEEHIYDTVGKPEASIGSQALPEDASKQTPVKLSDASKDEHSGMRKLFDSFRHKESPSAKQKVVKEEDFGERIYEKIDISSSVERPSETGRTFIDMKRERVAEEARSQQLTQKIKPQTQKETPQKVLNISPEVSKQKKVDTNVTPFIQTSVEKEEKCHPLPQTINSQNQKETPKFPEVPKQKKVAPSIQLNEPSTSTDVKTSVFHSISDNFMAIKDKMLHSKEKKHETALNHDKESEEYDLQIAASKNDLPTLSAGTFRPLKDDSLINKDLKKETGAKKSDLISDKKQGLQSSEFQESSPKSTICDPKEFKRPDIKPCSKVVPGTPDTLYDTCCMRLACLLGKKALEIVSDQTKSPPKKPPKPSAEAIAKARAEVVSKRLRELQCKGQSIGENIPVGYDGIRFADDETESSCDYKDLDNIDYIMDYELINRYKFDGKADTFSAQSTCSVSSYYTADTVTLKDEHFSDAPLETISLGSNDSYLFQNLSTPNQSDFNSLPASVKSKNKNISKLKPLDYKTGSGSNIQTSKKKIPPPLPPKPVLSPKQRDSQKNLSNAQSSKKDHVSQCINGLSLSPRLQSKFSKDTAATKQRPLLVAGLKGTEFTSLQTKSKENQKRTFNTVLKNESLKNISTISPLQNTKSSPSKMYENRNNQQSSLSKKISPQRPPPPFSPSHPEEAHLKCNTGPPVPEKPKRESRICSEKRTVSPQRPPPPVSVKTSVPPPRPPPPTSNFKTTDRHSYQNVESQSEIMSASQSMEPIDKQSGSPSNLETEVQTYSASTFEGLHAATISRRSEDRFVEVSLHENSLEPDVKNFIAGDQPLQTYDHEFTTSLKEEQTAFEPNGKMPVSKSLEQNLKSSEASSPVPSPISSVDPLVDTIPKPPPRTRRIRSRTVEIAPNEKVAEPAPRRSQSLTDMDIYKRTANLNVPASAEKVDLKHLYTSVNKDGKKLVLNGSQSPSLGCRPLPAPPPPPRKFRSLDRKPKVKQSKEEHSVSNIDENEHISIEYSPDVSIRPPERKKKGDKHRFHSLSTERKKAEYEFSPEASRIPRSNSVPLKPNRRLRHNAPEYDENANVAFPVVAEVHHSAIQLDECGNEILESPTPNIPSEDTVDSDKGNLISKTVSPHPRQRKDKNLKKKTHSSWYDESQTSVESWEIVNWDSVPTTERESKDTYSGKRPSMRRRSDPLAGRKERRTSQFYVDIEPEEGVPHADKETSPIHLDCSEKSVQTSLETLSQDIPSQDEQNEHSESSDNTDNLLSMVKTLQTELKTTLNRHKMLDDEENYSSSNAPTDSEKSDEPGKKLLKTPSIRSSNSELWPLTSSEESDGEMCPDAVANLSEIALTRKKKKIFYIAQEIMTSEEVFVDTLKLLNVDFKAAIETANKQRNTPVLSDDVLSQILNHLPQLQQLNENLLMELKDRVDNWEKTEKIADIIVKMGPFLKLYSWYIHDFESNLSLLEESKKKFPLFAQAVKEFEASARCKRLALNHFMLKPIQRIPQYRLLLQEYLHNLSEESPDYQDTITALQIVSEVANHANDSMKQGDNAQKLISIQNSIMGHKEIIKPGRLFVKEGELMKLSRKGMQPRWFVLFNDLLLYLTPVQQGLYRINHELPLTGMKVAIPIQQDYQNEFSIISVTRSFTLAARSQEERQEWIVALTKAIEENASKRSTFTNIRLSQRVQGKNSEDDDGEFVLGRKAPVWIPDARVTMCQLCTSEFTVTFRRHHCRACGKVVCSICSSFRIPLPYLGGNKVNRVCDECYSKLGPDAGTCPESAETDSDNQQIAVKPHLRTEHKYVKKGKRNLPSVLKEVCANDQGSTISGYLQKRIGKSWKKEWFVVKDKVLYEYKASEDVAALRSIPLLGFQIESFSEGYENVDSSLLFQLTHPGQAPIIYHADSVGSTERWIAALKEASVLE